MRDFAWTAKEPSESDKAISEGVPIRWQVQGCFRKIGPRGEAQILCIMCCSLEKMLGENALILQANM